jgi:hypothetical protein
LDGDLFIELEEGRVLYYHIPDLQFLAEGVGERGDQSFGADEDAGALFLQFWVLEEEVVLDRVADPIVDEVITIFSPEEL